MVMTNCLTPIKSRRILSPMPKRNDDTSSLSHTKWNCQYHIVFTPKYRRKAIYGKLRADIGKYLRRLCEYKGVEIVEAHAMSDHIHMLVKIPPKIAVSSFMGYLKGKSSLIIFDEHANLK
jgi:putative transposase